MIQTSEGNLPQGLDAAIRTGLERGRRTVARRARVRRGAVRSALCLALVLGLFAGGVNASPAFAAAMEELPILGRLVQVFRVNAPSVDGGQTAAGSRAALTMEREGDTEWLTLRYEQSSAGRYHAEFASFPKTVTLTLPGTERVEILSELSRAQDTSQYIKSVYTAEGWVTAPPWSTGAGERRRCAAPGVPGAGQYCDPPDSRREPAGHHLFTAYPVGGQPGGPQVHGRAGGGGAPAAGQRRSAFCGAGPV
ncbi:MAG: hypothetical protein ACLRZ3_13400 [Flavonifractor plautii]